MRSIPGALAATVAWLLAASVGAASEQPPCKAFDDGTRTRACQSFCNQAFASMHCPFCGCNTCRWCPQSFASSPPAPTASTGMKESVNGNRSALQEKVRVSAVGRNDSFATPHRQPLVPCKPLDTGESARSCAPFCSSDFFSRHCQYCACHECTFCDLTQPRPPPLPPRLPPPQPPPLSTVQRINLWWRNGKPSNAVTEAGVLVRQLDELNRKGFVEWVPCPEEMWCGKFGSIWPSSIINRNFNKALYMGTPGARREEPQVGFVLAPPPTNVIHCIFPSDGNSMGGIEHESKGHAKGNYACGEQCVGSETMTKTSRCSFPPEKLRAALEANAVVDNRFTYTEVIVDAKHMKSLLPYSLLGVFYMNDGTKANAIRIHSEFLAAFKGQVTADEFPIMHFSVTDGFRVG